MASEANFSCFDANLSRDFLTESVWTLNTVVESDTGTMIALTVIMTLLLLVGLPSNVLLIAVMLKKKLHRKQPAILLLLNLAVTDLLVCCLVMPWNIVTLIAGEFRFGGDDHTRCQVCQTGVILIILTFVTLNNLALLSVDRLVYLKRPIHYHKYSTSVRVLVATGMVWLLSCLVSIPPLFGFSEMRFSTAVGICTIAFSGSTPLAKNSHYLIFLAVMALAPILTLVLTNLWGLGIIQRHLRAKARKLKEEKKHNRLSFHEKMKRQQQGTQGKLLKVYGIIFITNLVTYLPMIARMIVGVAAEEEEFTEAVRVSGSIAYLALMSQAVVHPIVQASLVGDIRKGIAEQVSAVKRHVRKLSRSSESSESSASNKGEGEGHTRQGEQSSYSQSCSLERNWNSKKNSVAICHTDVYTSYPV